jgi:hypothetical protein
VSRISYILESFGAKVDNVAGETRRCPCCSLSRFGMSDKHGVRTPMEISIDVEKTGLLVTNVPNREAIGNLMYSDGRNQAIHASPLPYVSRTARYVDSVEACGCAGTCAVLSITAMHRRH